MVFGGHNKLVRNVTSYSRATCLHLVLTLQDLMKNGDPQHLIESGKKALTIMDW